MESPLTGNVKLIKSRFEGLQENPCISPAYKTGKVQSTLNNNGNNYRKISPPCSSPEGETVKPFRYERVHSPDEEAKIECRNRSQSVGNYQQDTTPVTKPILPVSRHKSIKYSSCGNNEYNSREHFTSFAEKQKLVESIVMNIKNTSKTENDPVKNKQKQTMTSKLEKDLKNALEKGVRRWHVSRHREKNPRTANSLLKDQTTPNEDVDERNYIRSTSKLSDTLPLNTSLNNKQNIDSDRIKSRPIYEFNRSTQLPLYITDDLTKRRFGSFNNEEFKENRRCMSELDLDSKEYYDASPVRPPRKRSPRKKNPAPQPPIGNKPDINDGPDSLTDCENICSIDNYRGESPLNGVTAAGQLNEKVIYYSTPPVEDIFLSNEELALDKSDDEPILGLDEYDESKSPPVIKSSLPDGPPPKKPPRTFAHDIYRTIKPISNEPTSKDIIVSKAITKDIESLYAKPKKRMQYRSEERIPFYMTSHSKPNVAPKPSDIVERSRKRFSIADPVTPSREENDSPEMKRNSSARFSLRRMKNIRNFRPNQLPSVARWRQKSKLSGLGKNELRSDDIRRKSKSEEILSSDWKEDDNDIIYATPLIQPKRPQASSQELHYMCSPLFEPVQKEESNEKEEKAQNLESHDVPLSPKESPSSSPTNRSSFMNGLRREFRQSCRLMQKRIRRGI